MKKKLRNCKSCASWEKCKKYPEAVMKDLVTMKSVPCFKDKAEACNVDKYPINLEDIKWCKKNPIKEEKEVLTQKQIETSQIHSLIILLLQKAMTVKAICRKLNISTFKFCCYVSKINKMPIEFLKKAKRYKITIEDDLVSLKTLYWDKDGNKDRVQELHDNENYQIFWKEFVGLWKKRVY
jgi:hypothetical protein